MEELQDVNTETESSSAQETDVIQESSPDAGQESVGESAETLNTESQVPEHVPYNRFKEVNDRYKSLKQYEELDRTLSENPELAEYLQKSMQDFGQNRQEPQAQDDFQDPVAALNQKVMALEAEKKVSDYKSEYDRLASGVPEGQRGLYDSFVEKELISLSAGDPIGNFNMKNLHKAFENVKNQLDGFAKSLTSQYVQDKQPGVPATSKGAIPSQERAKPLGDTQSRSERIAERLRASKLSG